MILSLLIIAAMLIYKEGYKAALPWFILFVLYGILLLWLQNEF